METVEVKTIGEVLETLVKWIAEGIEAGGSTDLMAKIVLANLATFDRIDILKTAAKARYVFDQSQSPQQVFKTLQTFTNRSDAVMANACFGYLLGAAYFRLGRFDEFQKIADSFGLNIPTAPFQIIDDLSSVPKNVPLTFGVHRCEGAPNPIPGSRVINCDTCGQRCWISPETSKAYVETQNAGRNPTITCTHCLLFDKKGAAK